MEKKKQYLFILCGEAFSGKSTISKILAKQYEAKIIGRDKIYFALDEMLALEDSPEDDEDNLWRNLLWPIAIQGIKNQLLLGHSAVVDDNCLFLNQREQLRNIAKEIGVKAILIYMNISPAVLKERREQNRLRRNRHDVPSSWLEEDAQSFERPTEAENPVLFTELDPLDDLLKKLDKI